MKRSQVRSVGWLLITCLVLAASVSGSLRAAHEIAATGQSTLVICGENGASVVTLDRDGVPIEPTSMACGHCSACSLISVFDLPALAAIARAAASAQPVSGVTTVNALIPLSAHKLPRGPPHTFRS